MSTITYPTPAPRFTPPSDCFSLTLKTPPDVLTKFTTSDKTTIYTGLIKGFTSSCYPLGFTSWIVTDDVKHTMWTEFPTYSRATCPSGYGPASTSGDRYKSWVFCCQSEFSTQWSSGMIVSFVEEELCTYYLYEPANAATVDLGVDDLGTSITRAERWFVTPVIVMFAESDQVYWNNTPTMSTITATPHGSASLPLSTSSLPPSDYHLSHQAKIGIGIGAALGTILLLALLFFSACWWLRKRRRDRRAELSGEGVSAQDEKRKPDASDSLGANDIVELAGPDVPGGGRAAELGSKWHGNEAPALIEVDLSRPFAALGVSNAGNMEKSSALENVRAGETSLNE
ncbi:hypothetical protein HII31_08160 [Pseudocercospora fuligena]|uniref:Uncharacterized protein n=1 Tax=Pseudocercospora fuligena TaxID=685502 RepID=A0A8H6RI43_9PEZI|nr:hypothetical protein HII31_08160 [Pseudocercospora fuligena]